MLVVIQEVSQEFTRDGAEYRKVTGLTGDNKQTTKNVFNNLEDKWELLKEGAVLEFTMEKMGSFWNVIDVKVPEMPPPQEPLEPEPIEGEYKPQIAPQEIGMWFKELGNRIGDGSIERDFPKAHVRIKGEYYKKMSKVTKIDFWKGE